MNQQLKKLAVLLVSKKKDHTCLPFMQQIRNQFPQHTYLIDDDYKNEPVDLVITIGGDGTILHASRMFQQIQTPPFVTFGKGTLGFMCIYSLRDQYEVLKNLQSPYNIELKKRIQGSLNGQYVYTALNDFFITKGNSIHVVCLDIYVNDTFVTQARGGIFTNLIDVDGLIISTPTGSTAYCLSAGGPLIQNRVPCIALVPICPLSLSFRPLILPLDVKISIKMNANSRGEGVVICDGQVQYDFKRNDCFDIIPSQNDVRFVVPPRHQDLDWVIKLQRMLNWNSRFQQPRD